MSGHWDGDFLCGSNNSQIVTLAERQVHHVMLVKVAAKNTEKVVNALIDNADRAPQELYKSLNWDHGIGMVGSKRFMWQIQPLMQYTIQIMGPVLAR